MGAIGAAVGGTIGTVLLPGVGTALGSALGDAAGNAIGSGGTGAAAPTTSFPSGLSAERLQALIDQYTGQYLPDQNLRAATPSTIGGVSATQASKVSAQQQKKNAFIQMRMSMGDTLEAATRKAETRIAQGQKFGTTKFKDYISGGNTPGLSIGSNGGIKAATQFQGGGIQTPGISQGLSDAMKQLSLQSVLSAGNLPQAFGQQAQDALGFQSQARNQLGSMLGGMDHQGLSPEDYATIQAFKDSQLQDLGDLNKHNIAGVVGDLTSRGFMSSNLAEGALQHGVYDPQSRFLTSLGGQLAGMQNDFLNSAANRRGQAFNNVSSAIGSAGTPSSIASILQGVTDPGQAGLFNDVNAGYLASQIQQQGISNARADQQFGSELGSKDVMMTPGQPTNPALQGTLPAGLMSGIGGAALNGLQGVASKAAGQFGTWAGKQAINGIKNVAGKIMAPSPGDYYR